MFKDILKGAGIGLLFGMGYLAIVGILLLVVIFVTNTFGPLAMIVTVVLIVSAVFGAMSKIERRNDQ